MATDRRPGWWGLYALVPLMAGLLVLEHRASLAPAGHKFAQIGVVMAASEQARTAMGRLQHVWKDLCR